MKKKRFMAVFSHIYTLAVILVGWAFFYFENMVQLREFFRAISFSTVLVTFTEKLFILNHLYVIVIGILLSLPFAKLLRAISSRLYKNKLTTVIVNVIILLFVLGALFVITSMLVGGSFSPNMYADYKGAARNEKESQKN